jgi:cysteine desulfurase/selenocysteine lyase
MTPTPPGLPDPAALARLANEFFAALPGMYAAGGVPVPANPQPAGLSLPPGATGPATPLSALPPGANLVPHSPQTAANAGASAQPQAPAYYFLAEPGIQPPRQEAFALPADERVAAQPFSLPGSDALRALLSAGRKEPPAAAPGAYYFVDTATPQANSAIPRASTSAHPPLRRPRGPARLPHPAGARERQATRVVRQRGHDAQAAVGHRPHCVLLRTRELEHPSRGA